MNGRDRIIITAVLLLSAAAASVSAQDGINIGGGLVLQPFISGEMDYDNNVFKTDGHKKDDWYNSYIIGSRLFRETDFLLLKSAGWFSQRHYDDYDEKDSDRWGASGLARVNSDKSFLEGMVNFRQIDDYDDIPAAGNVPAGFEGTVDKAFDRTTSEQKRDIWDAGVKGGYKPSDVTSLMLAYKYYKVDYDKDSQEDWYENTVGAEGSYLLTEKTAAFLNAQVGLQDGDGAPDDARLYTARVGLKNSLTDKSTVRAGVGVTYYDTDDDSYTRPSFLVDGTWKGTDKITVFAY